MKNWRVAHGRLKKQAEPLHTGIERPDPCTYCGSRPSCRHREVADTKLPEFKCSDGRQDRINYGLLGSPWGVHGNPSGSARQRMIDALKAQLFVRSKVED